MRARAGGQGHGATVSTLLGAPPPRTSSPVTTAVARRCTSLLPIALLVLALASASAQDSTALREFHEQVRVRLELPGLDSTAWFEADIRHTTEGCELVQLRNVAWQNGQARVGTDVPMNDRAVLRPQPVLEIQTRETDRAAWKTVDVAWFKGNWRPEC